MRERLQVDERRARLLELGLKLFGSRSYEDISIHDIAAEASISKGLLYHYFNGKRGFYLATLELAGVRLLEAITVIDQNVTLEDRSAKGLMAYLTYVEAQAVNYSALMHGGLGADKEVLTIVERIREVVVSRIIHGLGLDSPRPVFRAAARGWVGSVEASSLDWLKYGEPTKEELVRLLLGQLYAALQVASHLDAESGVVLDPALAVVLSPAATRPPPE